MNKSHSIYLILATLSSILPSFAAGPLRELSTDRPDTTESPNTVDQGHFQFETELASFTRDGGNWTEHTLGEVNAKYGLTDSTDIQFVLPTYTHIRDGDEGFGDIEVRLKHNLWGNDSGNTVMALMPFIKLPSAHRNLGNGKFEGGLIAPFAFSAPANWSCAIMAEVDLAYDEQAHRYHALALASATASHNLTETTACFLELVGIFPTKTSHHIQSYFNTGLTWAMEKNWQLDGGVRIGLTHASADLTPFVGISTKF